MLTGQNEETAKERVYWQIRLEDRKKQQLTTWICGYVLWKKNLNNKCLMEWKEITNMWKQENN